MGSAEAFERLVQRYEDSIYAYLWSRTRDQELSEELCQEVFVRAYQGLARFDPSYSFENWLCGIAHNLELQWRRQRKISRRVMGQLAEGGYGRQEVEAPGVPVYQRVLSAINACPPNYHLPLTMRYLDQMSYEEIASVLNMSPGQVKGLLYRGKQLLKERLADLLEDLDDSGLEA